MMYGFVSHCENVSACVEDYNWNILIQRSGSADPASDMGTELGMVGRERLGMESRSEKLIGVRLIDNIPHCVGTPFTYLQ